MASNEISEFTISYLRDLFRNYYQHNPVTSAIAIEKREVGIGDFGKKISARHLAFSNNAGLNRFLTEKTPFFISYSTAYYKYPERRPMENKILEGSDIVYEFDADDFNLPCKEEHDIWFCKSCEASGKGHKDICPECQGKLEVIEWICDKCLGHAKSETLRLIDFLETEFKLDSSSFVISFSGSKGYHLRVTDKSIIPLSKSSRLQMMNYIQGKDLDLSKLGFKYKGKQWFCPSPDTKNGWAGKLITYLRNYIQEMDEKTLKKDFSYSKVKINKLLEHKEVILNKMYNNILWHNFTSESVKDAKFWEDLLAIAISRLGFRIDPASSSDIYKIMRMPDTIHGGTGLLSTKLKDREALEKFDPFLDPVLFRPDKDRNGEVTRPVPRFRLLEQEFGPYSLGEKLELPEYVSVYLLLKGVLK